MVKIRRKKTSKSKRKRVEEMINKARPSKGMNDKNRSLILGKILGQIQGKRTMKSMKNRKKAMMKKYRPSEAGSKSVETVMLASEQHQQNYKMLLEILSRLPVKSLLRFMSANKHWKTVISSHPFRKMHREKHTSSSPLPIVCYNTCRSYTECRDPKKTYLITFDRERRFLEKISVPIPLEYFVAPAPSYHSKLLCFLSYELKKFYFYNPSTAQSFLLTNPSSFSSPELKEHCSAAYGYIPSKDEYIMVHLFKLSNGNIYCEVLENISISNDNFKLHYSHWRSSSTEATIKFGLVIGPTAFVGGAFYWHAFPTTNPKKLKDGFILSFDVEADSFSTIDYPPGVLSEDARLLDINNDLYLIFDPEFPAMLLMWKWSSDNKLWSLDWKFDFEKGFASGIHYFTGRDVFRSELFIYTLKYLKGYEDQPSDDQVSVEMGKLHLPDDVWELPLSIDVAFHTNLFTL